MARKKAGWRPGDMVVRHGGEELAMLLSDTDTQGGVAMNERFRLAVLARAITHGGHPQNTLTVSIGAVACLPDPDGSSYQFLIESADKALYSATALGRK